VQPLLNIHQRRARHTRCSAHRSCTVRRTTDHWASGLYVASYTLLVAHSRCSLHVVRCSLHVARPRPAGCRRCWA
jgi:hypothetical protein